VASREEAEGEGGGGRGRRVEFVKEEGLHNLMKLTIETLMSRERP